MPFLTSPSLLQHTVVEIFLSPWLYVSAFGYIIAAYTAWKIGRKQYWQSDVTFSFVHLWLVGALFGDVLFWSLWQLLHMHPGILVPWLSIAGIQLGGWTCVAIYTRRVHYPWWRVVDLLALSVSTGLVPLSSFLFIRQPTLTDLVVCIGSLLMTITLWLLYYLNQQAEIPIQGRIFGFHLVEAGIIVIAVGLLKTSWQQSGGLVELLLCSIGSTIGLGIIILRSSARSRKVILETLPRGVSQSFRETFNRAFLRQLSASSEHKTDDHE
jgi:hypothetical protein